MRTSRRALLAIGVGLAAPRIASGQPAWPGERPIQARLAEMLAAIMQDRAWIAEAERLEIPLRSLNAEDTRALVYREAEAPRRLRAERPWRDQ